MGVPGSGLMTAYKKGLWQIFCFCNSFFFLFSLDSVHSPVLRCLWQVFPWEEAAEVPPQAIQKRKGGDAV